MAIDEQSWHEAWDALSDSVGAEAAATLMGAWPRDVARRSDIDSIDAKIEASVVALDAKIDALDAKIEAKIEASVVALDAKIDASVVALDAKIDALDAKIDSTQRFLDERINRSEEHIVAVMRGELNAQVRSLLFGFVGLQATIGAFVVALLRFAV